MPVGPQGQRRPADTNACAVHVCKILTGEIEETAPPDPTKAAAGRAGGKARAKSLTRTRRREIGRGAISARWEG